MAPCLLETHSRHCLYNILTGPPFVSRISSQLNTLDYCQQQLEPAPPFPTLRLEYLLKTIALDNTMADYVWFITGASSGFGKSIALEALRRGHKVIASARSATKLGELKEAGAIVMDVDVTSNDETLASKLAEANSAYGKITHVVNAAGYILEGAVEETRYVCRPLLSSS